jgi:N-acetyl-alpha-D-glucosaminyl L-malate synthase BshA
MKIAMLCHSSLGGSGAVAVALSRELVARGHEVHIVSDHVPFSLRNELVGPIDRVVETAMSAYEQGVSRISKLERFLAKTGRVVVWPVLGLIESLRPKSRLHFHQVEKIDYPLFAGQLLTLTAASALVHLLNREKIDVIHAHYAIPFGLSALLARTHRPKTPIVLTVHGTDIAVLGRDASVEPMVVSALRGADKVTAVSAALAADAAMVGGIPLPEVIGNFVDLEIFQPLPREQRMLKRRTFARPEEGLLVHASNFREVKRPIDLVSILESIRLTRPARLLLVGDGPLIPQLKQMVRDRGLQPYVQFLGSVQNIERVLQVADVFLLPSGSESFGLAAAESLACGTPVVATRVGGIPEMVGGQFADLLYEAGDTSTAANIALSILLLSDDEREVLRAKCRSHAERTLSPKRPIDQYLAAYASVIK